MGVLELTALPGIDKERWVSWVRGADALLLNGGDALYLCHWMRESGLAGLLPSLRERAYVGLSAGSMVLTPRTGYEFADCRPPTGDDSLLGVVNFCIFPHLGLPDRPDKSLAEAERWAARVKGPRYATDAQTAIKVIDGSIEVVSEGHWKVFTQHHERRRGEPAAGAAQRVIGRLGGTAPAGRLLLRGAVAAIEIYWSWGTQSRNVLVLTHTALKPMSPV